ncbi:MAG: hypothetical protein ACJ8AD_03020 [Gemmatimonadaceae bacterium]
MPPTLHTRMTAAMRRALRSRRGKKRNICMHGDYDARSLALGKKIADRLARDASLVARARIQDRWSKASGRERKELDEWRRILDTATPARLRNPGERGTRLRQTLPFLGVVSEDDLNRR